MKIGYIDGFFDSQRSVSAVCKFYSDIGNKEPSELTTTHRVCGSGFFLEVRLQKTSIF